MKDKTIYYRIRKLSADQRRVLIEHLNYRSQSGPVKETGQLTAFVCSNKPLDLIQLKDHLNQQLPEFMIPGAIIPIEKIPKLPNGKIDRQALMAHRQQPMTGTGTDVVGPNNPVEKVLIKVWEKVLDLQPVGIHDNFFEIGGDSILSIQIVAGARKAGIALTPNQLFEHQTIAELAAAVKPSQVPNNERVPLVSGPTYLTPIQRWFFEQHLEAPHYWNQGLRIALNPDFTSEMITTAVKQLVSRHDSLRLSFHRQQGKWHSEVKSPDDVSFFKLYDLRVLDLAHQNREISERLVSLQQNLNLEKGGLFQCLYFQCGNLQKDQLLVVAHHLVIDAVSWQLLLDELQENLSSMVNGERSSPRPPTTSFTAWSQYLLDYAGSPEVLQDLTFWESQQPSDSKFPVDFQVEMPVPEQSIETLTFNCPIPELSQSLSKAANHIGLKMEEMLVAALTMSVTDWTKSSELLLGMEAHGRTHEHPDLDLSRSIGWFTSYYPLRLSVDPTDPPETTLSYIKARLKRVPKAGLSYGLLRYIEGKNSLNQLPPVIFNFMGNPKDLTSNKLGSVQWLGEISRHPSSERYYYLEVNAEILGDKIATQWRFSRAQYHNHTIEKLIQQFDQHLRQIMVKLTKLRSFTASDFPEANISDTDLNNLLDQL